MVLVDAMIAATFLGLAAVWFGPLLSKRLRRWRRRRMEAQALRPGAAKHDS
jgi:hypothetical protein